MRNKFLGCIIGGAVGDALGAPVEFMSRNKIIGIFGHNGIQEYYPAYGRLGAITDDTQMVLFTIEGLLISYNNEDQLLKKISESYIRWLLTQQEVGLVGAKEFTYLLKHQELYHRREPGLTCLSSLMNMEYPGQFAFNDSKGCGGVMRVAPIGLYCHAKKLGLLKAFEYGRQVAWLTHGHPSGIISAGCLSGIIYQLLDNIDLKVAIENVWDIAHTYEDCDEVLDKIELALKYSYEHVPPIVAIPSIGEGWVAEEALAISLYCSLSAMNFDDGIIMAVNHDGDSDSTGSITGNILGTIYGIDHISDKWLNDLELKDLMVNITDQLYSDFS